MAISEGLVVAGWDAPEWMSSCVVNPNCLYAVATHAAMFCVNGSVRGMSFWGKPDESDLVVLDTIQSAPQPRTRPQAWLVDLSRLEVLDLRLFDELLQRVMAFLSASRGEITRQAVVGPDGMAGVVIAELFVKAAGAIPVCRFADAREALRWMGVADHGLLAQLDQLRTGRDDASWLATRFRPCLDRARVGAMKDVARQMGISPRTLQRRLLKLGTSFQNEVVQARVRRAMALMTTTNGPLKSIAFEAGYASPQHFSAAFRQHVGMSPGRWRELSTKPGGRWRSAASDAAPRSVDWSIRRGGAWLADAGQGQRG